MPRKRKCNPKKSKDLRCHKKLIAQPKETETVITKKMTDKIKKTVIDTIKSLIQKSTQNDFNEIPSYISLDRPNVPPHFLVDLLNHPIDLVLNFPELIENENNLEDDDDGDEIPEINHKPRRLV